MRWGLPSFTFEKSGEVVLIFEAELFGDEVGKPVDTPQLVEVGCTTFYLHDGRATTLCDLLTTFDHVGILR